jgi:hypothetical protein
VKTTSQRKKVSSTLNSNEDEQKEKLEQEEKLKKEYSENNIPISDGVTLNKDGAPRKKKGIRVDEQAQIFDEKFKQIESALKISVSFAMDFLAERMPRKIPVTQTEKEFLAESLEAVMKKYKTSLIDYLPEVMLLLSVGAFSIPRMVPEKTNEKKVLEVVEKFAKDNDLHVPA